MKLRVMSFFFVIIVTSAYSFAIGKWQIFPYDYLKKTLIIIKTTLYSPKDAYTSNTRNEKTVLSNSLKPWSIVKNSESPFDNTIVLNNFYLKWKRIEVEGLEKSGAAKLLNNDVWYLNQRSEFILSKLSLTGKALNNGGVKSVFTHGQDTLVYVAYVDGDCATAKLVSLETNTTLLQLDCVPEKYADLNVVGGAVVQLNESEFLLSTGTPTTENVDNGINLLAQNPNSYWGKILRLKFIENKVKVSIFSSGHRNPQGMIKLNDKVFAVEHGPRGGDEINIIYEGKNYGWPLQSFGSEYDLGRIDKSNSLIKFHQLPMYTFVPSIGISYIAGCPQNYVLYYSPYSCLAVSSMADNAIYLVIYNDEKVFFTERLDFNSRIRKFFVLKNKMFAVTDSEGVIFGEFLQLK